MQNRKIGVSAAWIYVITTIMLATIAAIVYWSDPFSTFSGGERNFAIEHIDEIDRVKLSGNSKALELVKQGSIWRVQGAFEVRSRAMLVFLDALTNLQAEAPVSNQQLPRIQEHLLEEGVRVQIFNGRKQLKDFRVSRKDFEPTTYMLMSGATIPYQVQIPGFASQVASLFQLEQNYWRSPMVFDIKPQEIETVRVRYADEPEAGFHLSATDNGYYTLHRVSGEEIDQVREERIARYLAFFQAVKYEAILDDPQQQLRDSLLQTTPWVRIQVKTQVGDISTLEVYRKAGGSGRDAFGQTSTYDLDRAYALLNDSEEVIQIQYFVFDPIFKEIDYFRMP